MFTTLVDKTWNSRTVEQGDETASNYSGTHDEQNQGVITTQGIKRGMEG